MKTHGKRVLAVLLAVSLVSATWLASTRAQEAPADATPRRVGDDEAGRLPPGYTVVVTKAQRATIYSIQDSYQSQLAALKKQIAEIEGKRNKEIESLLDTKQKTILSYVLELRDRDRNPSSVETAGGN